MRAPRDTQPGEVRELVQRLAQLPLAELGGALAGFEWGFGKVSTSGSLGPSGADRSRRVGAGCVLHDTQADLLHWAELLDRFDDLFAAYIAANPALTLHSAQPPSPQQPCSVDDLLRVLHVSQTLLSNSGSRQAYSSVEVRCTSLNLFRPSVCHAPLLLNAPRLVATRFGRAASDPSLG